MLSGCVLDSSPSGLICGPAIRLGLSGAMFPEITLRDQSRSGYGALHSPVFFGAADSFPARQSLLSAIRAHEPLSIP